MNESTGCNEVPLVQEELLITSGNSFDPEIMSVYLDRFNCNHINENTWRRTATLIGVFYNAAAAARLVGVPTDVVATRIVHMLLGWPYAVNTFYNDPVDFDAYSIETWAIQKLTNYAAKSNHQRMEVAKLVGRVLSTFNGPSLYAGDYIIDELRKLPKPHSLYGHLTQMLPLPPSFNGSTVELWNPINKDSALHIGIGGYDRTGVVALRRIISDFQALRHGQFCPPLQIGKDQMITADSWMLNDGRKLELLFGEPMETLRDKGLRWTGPLSLNKISHGHWDQSETITTLGRVVGASVYSLMLRDQFIHDYVVEGLYPDVGSFLMPRTTFQNY